VVIASARPFRHRPWRQRGLDPVRLDAATVPSLLRDPPAALVVDLGHVPDAVIAAVWECHALRATPVFVIAGDAGEAAVATCFRRGASEVLRGDADEDLVAASVAAVLRRHRVDVAGADQPATVRLGDTTVDRIERLVRRADGSTCPLSRTEFALFEALLEANGRTCSHQALIARVWGVVPASAAHYLRLYIRYLRGKLEDDARKPRYIVNVWGFGYRLVIGNATSSNQARPLVTVPTTA